MKYSLRAKLSISYALVAVILVAALSIFTNIFLQDQFQQYVIKQQDTKNAQFSSLIIQQYDVNKKSWDVNSIEHIGLNALEQGMILKVYDIHNQVVWDATVHNNGVCNEMLSHMASNMQGRYPNLQGGYQEKSFSIDGGTLKIGYYGPFFLNDNDIAFINSFNQMLLVIGLLSLIVALILGAIIARRISDPIRKAIETAEKISRGHYGDRILKGSATNELDNLISTINNLASALEIREKMQKRLTSDVAHELRTPLATLQSHIEAMIDGVWAPDKARLVGCHEELLRINRMVGDLEELAKYDGENLKLKKSKFNLKATAEAIVQNFSAELKNKGLAVEVMGDEVEVFADKDKISQVIINLLANAIKFSSVSAEASGGQGGGQNGDSSGGSQASNKSRAAIRISVEALADEALVGKTLIGEDQQHTARISISDKGIGINKKDLPYVFERFYRADESRSRATGGSGIGLAIVKGIIDAHGGTIAVQSEVGQGTTFIIEF